MKITLNPQFAHSAQGKRAEEIIQKCVHCGFCNANCPTYRLTGEELDGPRGRIYQIKNLLEEGTPSAQTQLHLDRCLSCRRCETTCPSAVEYGALIDIARGLLEPRLSRPLWTRIKRQLLLFFIPYPQRLKIIMNIAQSLRNIMPHPIAQHIPKKETLNTPLPPAPAQPIGTVILPAGCIQSLTKQNTNQATTALLHKLGYQVIHSHSGCCGALAHHLSENAQTLQHIKHNIQHWYELLTSLPQPTHIVMTASGCGLMIKEYHHVMNMAHEQDKQPEQGQSSEATKRETERETKREEWLKKAHKISQSCIDLSELITAQQLQEHLQKHKNHGAKNGKKNSDTNETNTANEATTVAYHPPCTLQHGQKNTGKIEKLLRATGFELIPVNESDQCCGSAGSYSLFQPAIANQLKAQKLTKLKETQADIITTANIGCQLFLEQDSPTPITHWIELINQQLP